MLAAANTQTNTGYGICQRSVSPSGNPNVPAGGTVTSNNAATANVIVRLLLELEPQRTAMAVVLVPMDKSDQIAARF